MTIRLFLLVFIAALYSLSLNAQTEFAPIGAEWVYNAKEDIKMVGYQPLQAYYTIKCTGDTIINNLTFRKTGNFLLHQEGDRVWFWRDGSLHLIYDFGLQVGDTIVFTFISCINELVDNTYLVAATDTIQVNGISLKRTTANVIEDISPFSPYEYTFIEKIGSLAQLVELNAMCGFVQSVFTEWLRCYKDSDIDYHSEIFLFYNHPDCYYTPPNATNGVDIAPFSISPNPVTDILTITTDTENPITAIQLTDGAGRAVKNWQFQAADRVNVSFEGIPPGIYFCRVLSGEIWRTGKVWKSF